MPVSGIVLAPDSPAPAGGRPILAWAHGTVGLGDACAPSRGGDAGELAYLAGPFLERGFVVVATDYEGLGTAGIHPYLVGESEGRSVLDIARAARAIHAAGAGRDVVLLGHSQGGHAVLWAAQLGAKYAPDVRIVTTVAVAPAAELVSIAAWIAGPTSPPVARLNGLLVAAAWHEVYGLPLRPGLTAAGATIANRLPDACPDTALMPSGQPFEGQAVSLPRFHDLLVANTPGATRAEGSILLLQGTADEQIPAATNEAAARSLCAVGDQVQLDILPGVDHSGALVNEASRIGSWIVSRMAGVAVSGSCGT